MTSLQELQNRYGDFSVGAIISRWENFLVGENNFYEPENFPEQKLEPKLAPPDDEFPPVPPDDGRRTIDFTPSPPENKFSPVNIATSKDWAELRAEVSDLSELKKFFIDRSDSQSPQFINSIENYIKFAEKALATPQEIDVESSNNFVAALAEVIDKRLYKILTTCRYGKEGRGELPRDYYLEIEKLIEKYFERIGLHSEKVKPLDDLKDWLEVMKAESVPVSEKYRDKKIAEVEVQPRYFEYYNDAGAVEKFYIEGRCKYYKF